MQQHTEQGVVTHNASSTRRTDYLYRVSLKCLIRNEKGEILVVKESGREFWDLPGEGMDHGESIKAAIARELKEEINLTGDFSYRIIAVNQPAKLEVIDAWQLRLVFEVTPQHTVFSAGDEGDAIAFVNPALFRDPKEAAKWNFHTALRELILHPRSNLYRDSPT